MPKRIGKALPDRYRFISLKQLLTCIVENSDRQALDEFPSRPVFKFGDKTDLPLHDYLNLMREALSNGRWSGIDSEMVAEIMIDLLTDRLTNLPDDHDLPFSKPNVKQKGPDCRFYLSACLNRMCAELIKNPPKNKIEEERISVVILRSFVIRQSQFCRLEAIRMSQTFRSRFTWSVKGGKISVWLPKTLLGKERREWLDTNVPDPDPDRPNEKRRVQEIINKKLESNCWVTFEEAMIPADDNCGLSESPKDDFSFLLAREVAEEKAENIQKQRRSIKSLGPEKLKSLILRVFEDLDCGEFKEGPLASEFHISKSTMSRFAGIRWRDNGSSVPDLWRNTASVLSKNPIFLEVAKEAGYLNTIKEVLETNGPGQK